MISGFTDTYLQLTAEENKQYLAELKSLSKPEQEEVMEITTSWKEEGIQQGIEQGLQKGRQEGLEEGLARGRQEAANKKLFHCYVAS